MTDQPEQERGRPRPVSLLTSVTVPAAVLMAFVVAGCASDAGEKPELRAATSSAPSSGPTMDPTVGRTQTLAATPIVIEINGEEIQGELDDSATSASLLAQLPVTLTFRDYGGQEKDAELPVPLDLEGAPEGSDAAPLTIGYYAPGQRLVLYYDRVAYFAGIVPVGTYESSDIIEDQAGEFTVTISVA